jgi:hypothetical protein
MGRGTRGLGVAEDGSLFRGARRGAVTAAELIHDQAQEQTTRNGLVVADDGSRLWWLDGALHRDDGPAVEYSDGTREWWRAGRRHRDDGPALEWADGTRVWYVNGLAHREDGPAVEWADGTQEWRRFGELYREDGPTIEQPSKPVEATANVQDARRSLQSLAQQVAEDLAERR